MSAASQPDLFRDARFSGPAYDHAKDAPRLRGQIERVFELMADRRWRTLPEIAATTGDPEASVSAQLRHLRKPRFGSHTVNKRRRNDGGLWEYQLIVNQNAPFQEAVPL